MSAKVNVCNVTALNNPSTFSAPIALEITFEVFEHLPDDLEWKLIYVGSADDKKYDQTLDSILVGPVPEGRHKFTFEADPPDATKIPSSDLIGVTVMLLSVGYRSQEFMSVGFYVANEYDNEEMMETPPEKPVIEKLRRRIIVDEPRVTRFPIKWGDEVQTTEDTEQQQDDVGTSATSTTSEQMNSGGSGAEPMEQQPSEQQQPDKQSETSDSVSTKSAESGTVPTSGAVGDPLNDVTNSDQTPATA